MIDLHLQMFYLHFFGGMQFLLIKVHLCVFTVHVYLSGTGPYEFLYCKSCALC